jgi:hypothetical protein
MSDRNRRFGTALGVMTVLIAVTVLIAALAP